MYDINIQSTKDFSSNDSYGYKTIVRIVPTEEHKELIRAVIQWNANYIIAYYNPLLWIFNFSPLFLYIGRRRSEQSIINEIITIDEEMYFSFKKASTRKLFEKKVTLVLKRFIDKKLEALEEEENISIGSVLRNERYKEI